MNVRQIANIILEQRNGEEKNFALHLAVARVGVSIEGLRFKEFWLFNQELDKSRGNINNQRFVSDPSLSRGIAKNSRMGEFLIKRQSGNYIIDKKEHQIIIDNFSTYQPIKNPKIDGIKGTIEIKNRKKIRFNSLYELARFIGEQDKKNDLDIDHLLKDQQDALKIGLELTELENSQLKELSEITHYIRSNNEMRMQPILDAQQEEVKRMRILDGTLIIDGGPGTGKTTTLIQRIKFLTDETIEEYGYQYKNLLPKLKSKNGWIFFSPSTLLLTYLRNAMTSEGLFATDMSSKVWSTYLNGELLKNYGLVGSDKPFQLYRLNNAPLFNNNPQILKDVIILFEDFILNQIKERFKKFNSSKVLIDDWKELGKKIASNSEGITKSSDILRLILNADEIRNKYISEFENASKNTSELLQQNVDTILVRLKKDVETYTLISNFLQENFEKKQLLDDENDDDETETNPQVLKQFNIDLELRKNIRTWLRKFSLNKVDSAENIGVKQKQWVEIIGKFTNELPIDELGKKLHFIKNFQPFVQGSSSMLLDRFPFFYKRFRKTLPDFFDKHLLDSSSIRFKEILKSDIDRLDYDERNLLILFINSQIRKLQKVNAYVFQSSENNLINVYKDLQRVVIGIDEASDFSLLEIACMHSFSDPTYNCSTLSGDLMQRMTSEGLVKWESVIDFLGDGDVRKLTVSYRQSAGMLDTAKELYEIATGNKAEFTSYTEYSPYEPKPLVKKIYSLEDKVAWIAKNILSIYETYDGKIPSIAIFVPNDTSVVILKDALTNCDLLADIGIEVKGVTKDGALVDKTQVNIYNIETIKGLEFEAVFFIDIDKIENSNPEMILKYMYVGISRAAYYLFISFESELPKGLESFDKFIND
jgi:hypothetical protein